MIHTPHSEAVQLRLLPAQVATFDALTRHVSSQRVAILDGAAGMGKTTILEALRRDLGGTVLTSRAIIEASAKRHPLAVEETVYLVLDEALEESDVVLVDDFALVAALSCCAHAYPRQNFLGVALLPLVSKARSLGKTLVFVGEHIPIAGLSERVPVARIAWFDIEDYAALCETYLGDRVRDLDVRKVHRFAPRLNARQLRNTCEALRETDEFSTEIFLDYLRKHHMASNVDLAEVQAVDLNDLKGVDDVLAALEANVILPLENSELSEELNLKPKRGVLLAGPPGTGKTSIGRALAHRLKSKFFLIDGTIISGTQQFFGRVGHIFEVARQNAPCIVFIDDSDVLFESGQDTGLYRYLLTMLDGLESASAGRICLMMTAMDVGNLPPALVRSGRIELWLETRLPDTAARGAILADRCAKIPKAIGTVDVQRLAEASDGLSGADLGRVVEDAKLLYAYDRGRKASPQSTTEYFLRAIETVRRHKEQYAQAEAQARARRPNRPAYFDPMNMFGAMFAEGMIEGQASAESFVPVEFRVRGS